MSNIKKVAHVLTKMDVGGAETLLMNIYRNIDRSKYQFDFIVHAEDEGYYDSEIKKLGGRVIKIDAPEKVGVKEYGKQLIQALKEYGKYQAVHAHAHFFNGYILMMARKAGVKKRISHSHNSNDNGIVKDLKRSVYRTIMRKLILFNATDLLSCSDNASKELYGSNFNNVKFIPNCVNFSLFENTKLNLRKELGIDSNSKIIGHVGRFTDVKNHKFLISVFEEISKRLESVYLVLVGDGELKSEIQKLVNEKNISDRVFFLGIRSDVADVVQNFDLFMFPSKAEGLPLTLVEVQAARVRSIVAENITKDLLFTRGLITYLSIENDDMWIREGLKILKSTENFNKENVKFENTDFDIDATVKKLVNIYG